MQNKLTHAKLLVGIMAILMVAIFSLAACADNEKKDDPIIKEDVEETVPDSPIKTIEDMLTYAPKTAYDIIYETLVFDNNVPNDLYITFNHDGVDTITEIQVMYLTANETTVNITNAVFDKDIKVSKFLARKISLKGNSNWSTSTMPIKLEKTVMYKPIIEALAAREGIDIHDVILSFGNEKKASDLLYTNFKIVMYTDTMMYHYSLDIKNGENVDEIARNVSNGKFINKNVQTYDFGVRLHTDAVDKEYVEK